MFSNAISTQADEPEAESDNIFINEEEVVSSFLDPIYALPLERTGLYPEELITIFDELLRHRQQEGKRVRLCDFIDACSWMKFFFLSQNVFI